MVHVAETANVVEPRLGPQAGIRLLARVLELDNAEEADYEEAFGIAARYAVSVSDAVAYIKVGET